MKGKKWAALLIIVATLCLYMPVFATGETAKRVSTTPNIISQTAVLMDAKTGQVLFNKDMNKRMFPASITKIMTTILGVEKGNLKDRMTISQVAVDSVARNASHIALTPGEVITLEDAIYSALLVSANDSCNGIAEYVSGSIPEFAKLMTQKAIECGTKGTHFNNTNGLKDSEHYTTAYDMAMITRYGLQNLTWRKMFGTLRYDMPANNKQKEARIFYNQHCMISDPKFQYQGIIGGKAGYTTVAKFTLVTAAERNGVELIAVVMNSPKVNDKYKDTKALLDYGFENFRSVTIDDSKVFNHEMTITGDNGEAKEMRVMLEKPVNVLLRKDIADSMISTKCEFRKDKGGDQEAVLKVMLPASVTVMPQELATFPLTMDSLKVAAPVKAPDTQKPNIAWKIMQITLIVIGVLVGLFLLLIVFIYIKKLFYRRRRHMRRRR